MYLFCDPWIHINPEQSHQNLGTKVTFTGRISHFVPKDNDVVVVITSRTGTELVWKTSSQLQIVSVLQLISDLILDFPFTPEIHQLSVCLVPTMFCHKDFFSDVEHCRALKRGVLLNTQVRFVIQGIKDLHFSSLFIPQSPKTDS